MAGNRLDLLPEGLKKDMLAQMPPMAESPTLMGKGVRRLGSPKKVAPLYSVQLRGMP